MIGYATTEYIAYFKACPLFGAPTTGYRSTTKLEFEWSDAKAEENRKTHGVRFELAKTVFKDAFAIDRIDDREDYGEERFVIIGMGDGNILLFVAYAESP